jgi:hypothetical protein
VFGAHDVALYGNGDGQPVPHPATQRYDAAWYPAPQPWPHAVNVEPQSGWQVTALLPPLGQDPHDASQRNALTWYAVGHVEPQRLLVAHEQSEHVAGSVHDAVHSRS